MRITEIMDPDYEAGAIDKEINARTTADSNKQNAKDSIEQFAADNGFAIIQHDLAYNYHGISGSHPRIKLSKNITLASGQKTSIIITNDPRHGIRLEFGTEANINPTTIEFIKNKLKFSISSGYYIKPDYMTYIDLSKPETQKRIMTLITILESY